MSEKSEISEIRKSNLKELLKSFENQREMADAIGMAPNQLNHLLTGFRGVGEKLARKIEGALRIPAGSLDAAQVLAVESNMQALKIEPIEVTPEELGFINLLRDATSVQRKNAYEILKDFRQQNKLAFAELGSRYQNNNHHAHA